MRLPPNIISRICLGHSPLNRTLMKSVRDARNELKIPDCSASLGGAGASIHRAHSQTPPGKNAPCRPLPSLRPDMARCARHTAGPSVWTTLCQMGVFLYCCKGVRSRLDWMILATENSGGRSNVPVFQFCIDRRQEQISRTGWFSFIFFVLFFSFIRLLKLSCINSLLDHIGHIASAFRPIRLL